MTKVWLWTNHWTEKTVVGLVRIHTFPFDCKSFSQLKVNHLHKVERSLCLCMQYSALRLQNVNLFKLKKMNTFYIRCLRRILIGSQHKTSTRKFWDLCLLPTAGVMFWGWATSETRSLCCTASWLSATVVVQHNVLRTFEGATQRDWMTI